MLYMGRFFSSQGNALAVLGLCLQVAEHPSYFVLVLLPQEFSHPPLSVRFLLLEEYCLAPRSVVVLLLQNCPFPPVVF